MLLDLVGGLPSQEMRPLTSRVACRPLVVLLNRIRPCDREIPLEEYTSLHVRNVTQ